MRPTFQTWRLSPNNVFRRHLPKQLDIDDVLHLEEAVNPMLDKVIEVTIPAYTEVLT